MESRETTPIDYRRLALCFDGTWNTPEDWTNVSRLYGAVADLHSGCREQLKFYDEGVGTTWGSRLAGGAMGLGMDDNILQGYCWLINNYGAAPAGRPPLTDEGDPDQEQFEDGDRIYLFGFSRGAYTARSLAGLINRCGLLRRERLDTPEATPDSDLVKKAWELYRKECKAGEARLQKPWKCFRENNAHNVKVHFIGVWDTVGALGVPLLRPPFTLWRGQYGFHDTGLGRVIENAYHAMAIDEHRKDYAATLWTERHPVGTREVEQRWFPGAHANVGGGYEDDPLPDPPLRWLAEMAVKHGLEFTKGLVAANQQQPGNPLPCEAAVPAEFALDGNEFMAPVRDSYAEFMFGLYSAARWILGGRYYRPMLVHGVNEMVDVSASLKWAKDPSYRPHNFAYAGRADVNGDGGVPNPAHS